MIQHLYAVVLGGPASLSAWLAEEGKGDALLEKLQSFRTAAETYTDETWDTPANPWKHLPYDDELEDNLRFIQKHTPKELVRILVNAWEAEDGKLTLSRYLSDNRRIVVLGALLYQHGDCDEPVEYKLATLLGDLKLYPLLDVYPLSYQNAHVG